MAHAPRGIALSPFELGAVKDTVRDLLEDEQLSVSLRWVNPVSYAYDVESGVQTPTEDVKHTRAVRRTVTEKEVDVSRGRLQVGDIVYLVELSELPRKPNMGDKVEDGDDTVEVIEWRKDPIDTFGLVFARKV
jgi:hypothetical protein